MKNEKHRTRSRLRTPEEVERDRQLRAHYQSTRPSLADVEQSADYTPVVSQGEYLELMRFAAQVRARREALNLSLADVARLTGIDKAALSRLENGQAENPTYHTLDRVAKALNQRLKLVLEDEVASQS
jgi:DNA-binding Xre family transcriptional regulator